MKELDRILGIGAQIADIERIRRILDQDKLILIGHSFGAFLGTLYAAEFPERVRAMVLVSPAEALVMPSETGGLFEQVGKLLPEGMKESYNEYLKRYFDYKSIFGKSERELSKLNAEFGKYYRVALKSKGGTPPEVDQTGAIGGWMVHAMYFSMGKTHDYREALGKIDAPVLVTHGEKDIMPLKSSQLYADLLPNSRLEIIKGASHFAFNEQPKEFSKVVRDFLDRL